MSLSIVDLRAYVPAKDFEESRRFYQALGFAMSDGWGGTADFELNGHCIRLQNHYVKDWANSTQRLALRSVADTTPRSA